MKVLGISCYFHDASAALVIDGKIVAASDEERFSRRKHDSGFPVHAISWCLNQGGITPMDLDLVVFYEKPFDKMERILLTALQTWPWSFQALRSALSVWFKEKLWLPTVIQSRLGVPADKIVYCDHHLSHAASAFFCTPAREAAILTVDGVGEWSTSSFAKGCDNEIKILGEMRFPHSVGLLYSAFTAYLGFEVNEGEYKVMGMASFGKPRFVDKVLKTLRIHDDGSIHLDMSYFCYHYSSCQSFSPKLERLFGPAREPDATFFTESSGYPPHLGEAPPDYAEQCERNQYYADVAASLQKVVEDILVKMAIHVREKTNARHLCLAGGVALNGAANRRIAEESGFESIFIQPAAGDNGGALGAAFYGYHHVLKQPRDFVLNHPYHGQDYPTESAVEIFQSGEIRSQIHEKKIELKKMRDSQQLIRHVASRLHDGKVVGWCQGRAEWGPRALGNRSILANPCIAEMKDKVNVIIKFREPFRPFAPSILSEHLDEYVDYPKPLGEYPARYMQFVAPVAETKRTSIPAVTHVDGTCRPQAVLSETNPLYYDLISEFARHSKVPVLLNTSFNLKGEPIVNTPADAFKTFMTSGIDILVWENLILEKPDAASTIGEN